MSSNLSIRIGTEHHSNLLNGVELQDLGRLNVLTGINGAGKSTLLRKIQEALESSIPKF